MLVSIIIPCFNVENYIDECVNSVLAQTYPHKEIICIDNNSTDGTLARLHELAARSSGLIQVSMASQKGAPAARNKGIELSKGEWIQFLDADDLLLPAKIERQMDLIRAQITPPDVIAGGVTTRFADNHDEDYELTTDNVWKALVKGTAGYTCSNLYKRSAMLEVGGWNTEKKSSQETYLLFELLKRNKKVVFDPAMNTLKRDRATDSISSTSKAENWERYITARIEIWEYLTRSKTLTKELEHTLKQEVFDRIRFLYHLDPEKAISQFELHVKSKFAPVSSPYTGRKYLFLHSLLGFRRAQQMIRTLKPDK